jgi:alpha-ribazole phosphatase
MISEHGRRLFASTDDNVIGASTLVQIGKMAHLDQRTTRGANMSHETRWWWIRHAPVTSHTGLIYGQQDVEADFRNTAAALKDLAALLPKELVLITSDLKRASTTADAIAEAGAKWHQTVSEPGFREQHFGDWQGLSTEKVVTIRDKLPHSGWLAPAFERPPNGESFSDVIGRVVPKIIRHTSQNAGTDIVAVAHGGSIRAALAYALRLDPESALSFSVENLSLTRLDHIETADDSGVWRIVCVNRVFG